MATWLTRSSVVMGGGATISAHRETLEAHEAAQRNVDQRDHEEEDGTEGGCHAPVDRGVGEVGDEVADHLIAGAAHEGRCDVVAEGEDKDEARSGDEAGHGAAPREAAARISSGRMPFRTL